MPKLGDFVDLVRGTTYQGALVGKPGPALLGLGAICPGGGFREDGFKTYGGDCPPKLMLTSGDLFASLKGATKDGEMIGSVARVPKSVRSGRLTQDTVKLVFRRRDNDFEQYVYWVLRTPQYRAYCAGRATGSAVVALSRDDFLAYRVPPLTPDRTHCVGLLETIEQRIAVLHQTNATLESIAQALFKSWFIDFDPVRAKVEGREPEGMDATTAAQFPAELEESALGVMPRSWKVAAIQDVVENVYDGPHATPPEVTEGPVFLGIKNLTGTSIDLNEVRHISENDWARWTKRVTPQANDIVFSYEAALGLFALIPPGLRCCLGRRLALVRPKTEAGTPHFWFHQFISAPFQGLLNKHTVQGATVNRIALKEFPSFAVMDPGEQLRTAFEAIAEPLWERIHANRQQALSLAELRDTLLPRLISGKIRLPEAQEQLEGATV